MSEPVSSSEPTAPTKRTVNVAVVGSGLAGLTAAYLLSTLWTRPDVTFEGSEVAFEVHVFEKAATLGMDAHSASLLLPEAPDAEWRVDVPMRSFQGGHYPQLIRLYTHLGVAFRKTYFSYSFTSLPSPPDKEQDSTKALDFHPHLVYEGASGKKGLAIPTARRKDLDDATGFARSMLARLRLGIRHMMISLLTLGLFLRFTLLCAPLFRPKHVRDMTWEEWVEESKPAGAFARWTGFAAAWDSFIAELCVPIFSGICTASREDIALHPAEELLDFNWSTLGTHHYLVSGGVRHVVSRLSEHLSTRQIHTSSPATAIVPDEANPALVSIVCASPNSSEPVVHRGFSHVILATQAKYAAVLVRDYAAQLTAEGTPEAKLYAAELSVNLARVAYRDSVIVNHTDPALLPTDKRDRRDLNFVTVSNPPEVTDKDRGPLAPDAITVPPSYSMATHILERPEHVPELIGPDGEEARIYQTTNPIVAPAPERVLSVTHIERALLTMDGKRAASMLFRLDGKAGRLQGAARREKGDRAVGLWAVGSYAYKGIPLLEGCVASARDVVAGVEGIVACEGGRVQKDLW